MLYKDAAELKNLYSLLIVKNGYLVAKSYFNWKTANQSSKIQSVTKSFTLALAGIALEKGFLKSTD